MSRKNPREHITSSNFKTALNRDRGNAHSHVCNVYIHKKNVFRSQIILVIYRLFKFSFIQFFEL